MLGRSAIEVGTDPDVLAASAPCLRAPDPGPAAREAAVLGAGRSAGQVRTRMTQGGETCVEALITTGELDRDDPYWQAGLPSFGARAFEDCERLAPVLPDGTRVALMEQIEVRLEPEAEGVTRGVPSGRGELRGWPPPPEGEPL